uniref:putative barnase/colicin E5 family endoribonuclease n=1 Tax=Helicobacter vulpis TaxID=2316076 RepID=UPI0013CDFBFD
LGYIDLVWGANAQRLQGLKGANGKPLKPYGLSKIVEKHLDDFSGFEGGTSLEKLAGGLEYLVRDGELKTSPTGIKTIVVPTKEGEFRVGLSEGWFGKGDNTWVITAYEYKRPPVETFGQSTSPKDVSKGSEHGHLAQKDLDKHSIPPLKYQVGDLDRSYEYTDFRGTGLQAIALLDKEKDGQVRAAFKRGDLGEIDLIWGKGEGLKEGKAIDIGLSKILRNKKAYGDFIAHPSLSERSRVYEALTGIIHKGVRIQETQDISTLWLKNGADYHGLTLWLRSPNRNGKQAWVVVDHQKTKRPPAALKGYHSPTDYPQEWGKALGLKNDQQTFRTQFSQEMQEALLGGKLEDNQVVYMELGPHTLFKIQAPNPKAHLLDVPSTLNQPDILSHVDGGLYFLKEFKGPKEAFISVAHKTPIGWEFSRHALEELPQLQAQIQQGKMLYKATPKKAVAKEPIAEPSARGGRETPKGG